MITQEVASTLFQQMTGTMKNPYGLTERELEILHCLTEGHRYKAIASKVHLSEGTVRNYISTIYSKMQVQSRDEAIEKLNRVAYRLLIKCKMCRQCASLV
ncbi:LuxR C-terminal-related transcriptional regulator [Paenibacillus polymyxa]|uniref:response regulator transcription factor n=1 Tax=Paenibacillus polymyxa TaxID=1406 RepID=UPI003D26EB32